MVKHYMSQTDSNDHYKISLILRENEMLRAEVARLQGQVTKEQARLKSFIQRMQTAVSDNIIQRK
jgi:hypothetical protein